MKKILITGANGFIGSSLVSRLEAQNYEILRTDSTNDDIAKKCSLTRFSQHNVSHVFHLAGKSYVPKSWDNPQSFFETNVMGTVNVLEFCRESNISLTNISAYIYGHPSTLPIEEDTIPQPNNPYALTKQVAEEICEFYAREFGLSITTIRPFNVYGKNQAKHFLIPSIIEQALDSGDSIIVENLEPKRDYIYIEDLVTALSYTMNSGTGYRVYNIGSGNSLSVREIIDEIQQSANTNKKIICTNKKRVNELSNVIADISKSKHELDWQPSTSFRDGINAVVSYEQQRKRNAKI